MITPRFSLLTRLSLYIGSLLILSTVILGTLLIYEANNRFDEFRRLQAASHANTLARGSADALLVHEYDQLESWTYASVPNEQYAYAFITAPDNTILFHTDLALVSKQNQMAYETDNQGNRSTVYNNRRVLEITSPIQVGKKNIGTAHVAYYDESPIAFQTNAILTIALIVSITFIILFAGIFMVSKKITTPIKKLTETVVATQPGDELSIPVDLKENHNEVAELAQAFEKMTALINESNNQLRTLNQQLEKRVLARTKSLLKANENHEMFTSSVSHDLKAPIRRIKGYIGMLQEDCNDELSEESRSHIKRIGTVAKEMSDLINGLLSLSRIDKSKMLIGNVNLTSVANIIASNLQENEPDRNVTFHIQHNLSVLGDTILLKSVLENLMSNAWKYSSKTTKTIVEVGATGSEEKIYFVRDNGIGFNSEYAHKLFTPFQRLHSGNDYTGSGIGLTTVKRIIERHNGRIWAESEPGIRTTFYFTIATPNDE